MEKSNSVKNIKALVIGGSAGSLGVILQLLPQLRTDLPVAIIIVLHRNQTSESLLTAVLASKTSIPVSEAEEKEPILTGHIYVAPSNYHLLIEQDHTFSLDDSEKINFSRPSIDITFESAAMAYGPGLSCLLLSGSNADGTNGLRKVVEHKGYALVQTPSSAEFTFMPANAVSAVKMLLQLHPADMAQFINNLC